MSDRDHNRHRTAGKLLAFAGLLAGVFAAAAFAGSKVAPEVDSDHGEEMDAMQAHTAHDPATVGGELPGLAVAAEGYRLIVDDPQLGSGRSQPLRFRIVGADGQTVRDFDTEHTKRMHLIVVRRDFARFQHLHPRQLADGRWQAEVDASAGGVYRMFADFAVAGESLTLAADLFAPGRFEPEQLPPPTHTAAAGGGYEVSLDSGPAHAGEADELSFSVTRRGEPVDAVQPYLGADGHLVALREHDQAFLHVHPEGEPGGSGPIVFAATFPTPGSYRLFLQCKVDGQVRTAAFTQLVTADEGH